jgi:site-specific recombinase XerD
LLDKRVTYYNQPHYSLKLGLIALSYSPLPLFDNLEFFSLSRTSTLHYETYISDASLLTAVKNDHQHASQFLYSYRGSSETFKAYRREIERLLQWCWFVRGKSLKDLTRIDCEAFLEFCQAPPKNWIGNKHVARFKDHQGARIPNELWRPFVTTVNKKIQRNDKVSSSQPYMLSQSALQAIFAILSSFYNYLAQENYAPINPVAQIRQKSKFLRKQQSKRQIRRLSELQWSYVIETAELMAKENPALHERTLFIMTALFAMYLRISELAASDRWIPQMGHFYQDMDGNWWFKTVGKGNKERDISVSDAMLAALRRYRRHLGLTSLPSPAETTPLIAKAVGVGPIEGTRHIRKLVQACFDRTIARLTSDGFNQEADMLLSATVHWLRHTGISEDVKHRPREHVRDDAGHSSSAITDRYIDIELRARHASARKKPLT